MSQETAVVEYYVKIK